MPKQSPDVDEVVTIFAGKFRRYHGESFISHLLDVKTLLLNLRDLFYFLIGGVQSLLFVAMHRPDIAFIKGGFVGAPVGKALGVFKAPYITHDSDTVPGLANKLIAKKAKLHATGMPEEFYSYPKDKTKFVGIPLAKNYSKVTDADKRKFKNQVNIPKDSKLVSVTGGSLGARSLNESFAKIAGDLLESDKNLYIFHQKGKQSPGLYDDLPARLKERVIVKEFTDELYAFTGVADVVVTRAGATTIAELAVQGKACVFVPGTFLTGGQQVKNAKLIEKEKAGLLADESEPEALKSKIIEILESKAKREQLEQGITKLAKPDSTEEIAEIILGQQQ